MFDKPLPFFIRVWYYKTHKRMYVLKMCSKEMGGLIMANAAGTAQKMRRRKENHKFSRMMAVILGLIVTDADLYAITAAAGTYLAGAS